MRWLILVPYYFFGSILLGFAALLVSRFARANVDLGRLAAGASIVSVAAVALPLIAGWTTIDHYRALPMLSIGLVSALVAAVDLLVARSLPLGADEELEGAAAPRRSARAAVTD
ncbi:MAG: hypothetical protein QOD06_2652 [Candidatus Binatota bacterium]|jgi:hypothetical protein|nr:hypothetical protein [Candidatus Binatota bacterium]